MTRPAAQMFRSYIGPKPLRSAQLAAGAVRLALTGEPFAASQHLWRARKKDRDVAAVVYLEAFPHGSRRVRDALEATTPSPERSSGMDALRRLRKSRATR